MVATKPTKSDEESKLKEIFRERVAKDFHIREEVSGRHLIEDKGVRIDFMLFPKDHVIAAGFEPQWFGVEAKFIHTNKSYGNRNKLTKLVWQCITYGQSVFKIDGEEIRPLFIGFYINDIRNYPQKVLDHYSAIMQLGFRANVVEFAIRPNGDLLIEISPLGTDDAQSIYFASTKRQIFVRKCLVPKRMIGSN